MNTLEGVTYFQGSQTVNDYLDAFQSLVSDAGYTDPRTLVVKFRHGLRSMIQNQIATMPMGHPRNTDPQAWFKAAHHIDQAQLANDTFQSNQKSPLKPTSLRSAPISFRPPVSLPTPVVLPRPPVVTSMGVPMDIDIAKRTQSLPT